MNKQFNIDDELEIKRSKLRELQSKISQHIKGIQVILAA